MDCVPDENAVKNNKRKRKNNSFARADFFPIDIPGCK